jgi:hypothetical protein
MEAGEKGDPNMSLWARCPRCGEIADLSVHKCTSQEQPKNSASVVGKKETNAGTRTICVLGENEENQLGMEKRDRRVREARSNRGVLACLLTALSTGPSQSVIEYE